jgi:hypothetical protein
MLPTIYPQIDPQGNAGFERMFAAGRGQWRPENPDKTSVKLGNDG